MLNLSIGIAGLSPDAIFNPLPSLVKFTVALLCKLRIPRFNRVYRLVNVLSKILEPSPRAILHGCCEQGKASEKEPAQDEHHPHLGSTNNISYVFLTLFLIFSQWQHKMPSATLTRESSGNQTLKVRIPEEKRFVKPMEPFKVTQTVQDYLRAIYVLGEENQPVIAARVADEMGVSASTMVSTLRRLEREGYVKMERRKEIRLTSKGREVAEAILRRHFLTERLLTDILGLDWVKAHQEAHRLEHAISSEVEERLVKLLHHPTTCPHGNFIPGQLSSVPRKGMPLDRVPSGSEVIFQCITEGGERDARLLGFLQQHRLLPEVAFQVVDVAPSLGIMTLKVGKDEFSLGIEAAKKIRVGAR